MTTGSSQRNPPKKSAKPTVGHQPPLSHQPLGHENGSGFRGWLRFDCDLKQRDPVKDTAGNEEQKPPVLLRLPSSCPPNTVRMNDLDLRAEMPVARVAYSRLGSPMLEP